jgi:hypothetical protein
MFEGQYHFLMSASVFQRDYRRSLAYDALLQLQHKEDYLVQDFRDDGDPLDPRRRFHGIQCMRP